MPAEECSLVRQAWQPQGSGCHGVRRPGHSLNVLAGALLLCTGCQLAMLALLSQAGQAATGQAVLAGAPLWHPQALAGFVGVSGAYDLEGLAQHLHKRGLYKNLLDT